MICSCAHSIACTRAHVKITVRLKSFSIKKRHIGLDNLTGTCKIAAGYHDKTHIIFYDSDGR